MHLSSHKIVPICFLLLRFPFVVTHFAAFIVSSSSSLSSTKEITMRDDYQPFGACASPSMSIFPNLIHFPSLMTFCIHCVRPHQACAYVFAFQPTTTKGKKWFSPKMNCQSITFHFSWFQLENFDFDFSRARVSSPLDVTHSPPPLSLSRQHFVGLGTSVWMFEWRVCVCAWVECLTEIEVFQIVVAAIPNHIQKNSSIDPNNCCLLCVSKYYMLVGKDTINAASINTFFMVVRQAHFMHYLI